MRTIQGQVTHSLKRKIISISSVVLLAAGVARADVTIGNPAPQLPASLVNVQGEPLTGFEKGKVYIVEFWATWCGPCKASIPHLNQLQKQYAAKGLTVLGIAGLEHGDNNDLKLQGIKDLVAKMGGDMTYNVAFDPNKDAINTWLYAAGINFIPCAFLVDQQGNLVFIDDPENGLEEALQKLLP